MLPDISTPKRSVAASPEPGRGSFPPVENRRVRKKGKDTTEAAKEQLAEKKRHLEFMRETRREIVEVEKKAEERQKAIIEKSSAFIPDSDDVDDTLEKDGAFGKSVYEKTLFYGQTIRDGTDVIKMGHGVKLWANPPESTGDIYEGLWGNNAIKGHGVMRFFNGDVWTGQFGKNEISGLGKYEYSERGDFAKDVFIGSYYGGQKHGAGLYKFAKLRAYYRGEFSRGQYSGWGMYKSAAEEYGGQFDNDVKQGLGVQQWGTGYDDTESQYSGEFLNDLRDGYGVLVYKDGSHYSGQFKAGMPHGLGRLQLSLEEFVYEGTWEAGLKHGQFMVAQTWRPTTEWRTHTYRFDQIVEVRQYDYQIDFMGITSRARATAIKAEELAEKARDFLASKVVSVSNRVDEIIRMAQRHIETALRAAIEARIMGLQHKNYRVRMRISKKDLKFTRRNGKKVYILASDFTSDDVMESTGYRETIKIFQNKVSELRARVVTSFAQNRPKEREYKKNETKEIFAGTTLVGNNRVRPILLEELKTEMRAAANAQFSKVRMVDNQVKNNWLSMKELTDLIQCCVDEKDKRQIVDRYFDRLVDYQYAEGCAELFEDKRYVLALFKRGEERMLKTKAERDRQQRERGYVDKELEEGGVAVRSVFEREDGPAAEDEEDYTAKA